MINNFKAEWSGGYPSLCFGEWHISYDGEMLTLPESIKCSPMNTFKEYQSWHFNDDYIEEFESYDAGKDFNEWILDNHAWIDDAFNLLKIETKEENYKNLYDAINAEDWRHNSCGGCI